MRNHVYHGNVTISCAVGALFAIALPACVSDRDEAADVSEYDSEILGSVTCNVVTNHCESASIAAGTDNEIDYIVDPGGLSGCSYRIRDTGTQVVVRSGRTGQLFADTGTVSGLVGRYRLEMFNCAFGAGGWLFNNR
jgi:hypothetical protein